MIIGVKVWALVVGIRIFPWNLGHKNVFTAASMTQNWSCSKYVDLRRLALGNRRDNRNKIMNSEVMASLRKSKHLFRVSSYRSSWKINRLVSIDLERNCSTLSLGTDFFDPMNTRGFQIMPNCDLCDILNYHLNWSQNWQHIVLVTHGWSNVMYWSEIMWINRLETRWDGYWFLPLTKVVSESRG